MSEFKDQVEADIYGVFLNLDEFADYHYIDGKKIQCVVDEDKLRERQAGAELAVAQSNILVFAHVDDLPTRQVPGQTINVDNKEYVIDDWQVDMGVATLTLRQQINW